LRRQGEDVAAATAALRGLTVSSKNELLFQHGISFNELPSWQRRGSGLCWEEYERTGENPVTGERGVARRRRIRRDGELPLKDAYSTFLRNLMTP
jgi:tRNA(His) guanylyltransferase